MKIAEFFGRAYQDATYRREKLEELRYFKKVCIGGLPNKSPLPTPANVTPPAGAPVAPPTGAAGL
jgi:hypothetical protein